ncbi:MAG: hypothetical protein IJL98_05455 [Lachnospiraceae bacterium]|nr:hypothetical protein [Lachnospiraceae bacterium]
MPWWGIVLIVIGVLLIGVLLFAFFYGRKMQKKQAEAEKQMEAAKQTVSMLVIAKAKKKLKEAGLPDVVVQSTPRYYRLLKVPVVKAKVGPRVMNLLADAKVFDILPVNKTCTVSVSGMYITELKSVRGGTVPKVAAKKTFRDKLNDKIAEMRKK